LRESIAAAVEHSGEQQRDSENIRQCARKLPTAARSVTGSCSSTDPGLPRIDGSATSAISISENDETAVCSSARIADRGNQRDPAGIGSE
jgi:hypothetical protein